MSLAVRVDGQPTRPLPIQIVGIDLDGWSGLSSAAQDAVAAANLVIGSDRHLAMLPSISGTLRCWDRPLVDTLPVIEAARQSGSAIVVVATGDPLDHGVAKLLIERFGTHSVAVTPGLSAVALACARLGWPREETSCVSLHGRPAAKLIRYLAPKRRILCLTDAASTADQLAKLLAERGWGMSALWRLTDLGSGQELVVDGVASAWRHPAPSGKLEVVAIEAVPADATAVPSGFAPDDTFEHDGQLSKATARALAIAALNPLAGQVFWDLGAGCGGTAISWLRQAGEGTVIAVERDANRCGLLSLNAEYLGTPEIRIVQAEAIEALPDLPKPNAIFVGGGCRDVKLLRSAFGSLGGRGRFVAQAVSAEGQVTLQQFAGEIAAETIRFHVEALSPLGSAHTWRPTLPVVQISATKL